MAYMSPDVVDFALRGAGKMYFQVGVLLLDIIGPYWEPYSSRVRRTRREFVG